ncbi:MAG: hypothetical protein DRQ02_06265 [Candidatus Latescibacterota bacterium]|nr:MAG: hypothetical protein DRQ02_06265 [Candidatus Latescibacterota bacterium]
MVKRYRVKNLVGDVRRVLNEKNEYVLLKKGKSTITTKPDEYINNLAFKVTEIDESGKKIKSEKENIKKQNKSKTKKVM